MRKGETVMSDSYEEHGAGCSCPVCDPEEVVSIDSIAEQRGVLWECVFEEFKIWIDSRRQQGVPRTMDEAVRAWKGEIK